MGTINAGRGFAGQLLDLARRDPPDSLLRLPPWPTSGRSRPPVASAPRAKSDRVRRDQVGGPRSESRGPVNGTRGTSCSGAATTGNSIRGPRQGRHLETAEVGRSAPASSTGTTKGGPSELVLGSETGTLGGSFSEARSVGPGGTLKRTGDSARVVAGGGVSSVGSSREVRRCPRSA